MKVFSLIFAPSEFGLKDSVKIDRLEEPWRDCQYSIVKEFIPFVWWGGVTHSGDYPGGSDYSGALGWASHL